MTVTGAGYFVAGAERSSAVLKHDNWPSAELALSASRRQDGTCFIMHGNLADAYLKTARAKYHLDSLRDELAVFYDSEPYRFLRQDDAERQRHRLIFQVRAIPDQIWLIAGDFLYCLRASLDHLVWALARLTTDSPSRRTQFPILNQVNDKHFERQTRGVPPEAATIIKDLQPYHRGDAISIRSHQLWQLGELSNLDKHRRIPLNGVISDFQWPLPSHLLGVVEFDHQQHMIGVPIEFKEKLPGDPAVTLKIIFGDPACGLDCDFDGMEQMYKFVAENVLPRFARFFK